MRRWRRALTGAWIETSAAAAIANKLARVAPSRARGLKQLFRMDSALIECRALTGAWIETANLALLDNSSVSRPHGRVD